MGLLMATGDALPCEGHAVFVEKQAHVRMRAVGLLLAPEALALARRTGTLSLSSTLSADFHDLLA